MVFQLICTVLLLVSYVVAEAPYPPRGWRPQGPTFELPQRQPERQYLPSNVDPRSNEPDLSVQGLPSLEQTPQFQVSPISGLQYLGPHFLADLKILDQSFRRSQFNNQQRTYQQFSNQRQEYDAPFNSKSSSSQPGTTPITFTTSLPEQKNLSPRVNAQGTFQNNPGNSQNDQGTAQNNQGTVRNNQGNALSNQGNAQNKQGSARNDQGTAQNDQENIQKIAPELLLAPLAQLKLRSQQNQLKAAIIIQPNNQVNQKLINQQFAQIQAFAPQAQPQLIPLVVRQRQSLPQGVIILRNGQQDFDFNEETVDILPQNRENSPRVEGVDPKQNNDNDEQQRNSPRQFVSQPQPQSNQVGNQQQQFYQPQNSQSSYQPSLLQFNQQPQYQRAQVNVQPAQVYQQPAQINQQEYQQPAQINQQTPQGYQQPAQQVDQPQIRNQQQDFYQPQNPQSSYQTSLLQFNQQAQYQPAQLNVQPAQVYQLPAQINHQEYQQPAQINQQTAQGYQQPAQQVNQPQLSQITSDDLYNYYLNQQQILQQQQLLQQQLLQQQLNAQAAQNQDGLQSGSDGKEQADDDVEQDQDGGVTASAVAVSFGGRPVNEYGTPEFRTTNQYPTSDKPLTQQDTAEVTTERVNRRQNTRYFRFL